MLTARRFKSILSNCTIKNKNFKELLECNKIGEGNKLYYYSGVSKSYRYMLGQAGKNPLIVVGINPSTATPEKLDATVRNVNRICLYQDAKTKCARYDSFIMLNIYPQRDKNPDNIHKSEEVFLRNQNIEAFKWVVKKFPKAQICAAWGNSIDKRDYLFRCLKEIVDNVGADKWVKFKDIINNEEVDETKAGHPFHPLYRHKNVRIVKFDIESYLKKHLTKHIRDNQVVKITIKSTSGFCSVAEAYEDKLTITRDKITYHYLPEVMRRPFRNCDEALRTVENPEIKWTMNYGLECLHNDFEKIAELAMIKLKEADSSHCCDIGMTEIEVEFIDNSKLKKQFFQPADYFYDLFKCIQTLLASEAFKMPVVIRTSELYE